MTAPGPVVGPGVDLVDQVAYTRSRGASARMKRGASATYLNRFIPPSEYLVFVLCLCVGVFINDVSYGVMRDLTRI